MHQYVFLHQGEDQYEEDDYWEEGLDAQTTMAKEYPVLVEEVIPVKPKQKSETAKKNMPIANAGIKNSLLFR